MPFSVTKIRGIEPHQDTDHNETDVSKLHAIVLCTGTIDDEVEDFPFGLIPTDLGANANKVRMKLADWLQGAGNNIPEYIPPTAEELRAEMMPLTARQFRLGLLSAGRTLAQVETAINSIADPMEKSKAMVEWEYANTFDRTHPLVVSLASGLGFTQEEVDTLWEQSLTL